LKAMSSQNMRHLARKSEPPRFLNKASLYQPHLLYSD
jgi:hypothetical protein